MVYVSQDRRPATIPPRADEAVDALWAQALPGGGLKHASAEVGPDRLDLLPPTGTATQCATRRAADLLAPCHQASPLLHHRSHWTRPAR